MTLTFVYNLSTVDDDEWMLADDDEMSYWMKNSTDKIIFYLFSLQSPTHWARSQFRSFHFNVFSIEKLSSLKYLVSTEWEREKKAHKHRCDVSGLYTTSSQVPWNVSYFFYWQQQKDWKIFCEKHFPTHSMDFLTSFLSPLILYWCGIWMFYEKWGIKRLGPMVVSDCEEN